MTDEPPWLAKAQDAWRNRGQERPSFALEPTNGQESVWDYPRPPIIVKDRRRVTVTARAGAQVITVVDTTDAVRVLETASPPTFYFPPSAVLIDALEPAAGSSHCEWKGYAQYWAAGDSTAPPVGWSYPRPYSDFSDLSGWFSFYPGRIECIVDGETVRQQPGGFYGGWVTDEIVGPIKGEPGTQSW